MCAFSPSQEAEITSFYCYLTFSHTMLLWLKGYCPWATSGVTSAMQVTLVIAAATIPTSKHMRTCLKEKRLLRQFARIVWYFFTFMQHAFLVLWTLFVLWQNWLYWYCRNPCCPLLAPEPQHQSRRTGGSTPWTWTFFRLALLLLCWSVIVPGFLTISSST